MSPVANAASYVVVVAAGLSFAGGCRMAHSPKYETISVCELVRPGPQMDERYVRVKALFVSDRRHNAALFDERCPLAVMSLSLSNAKDRDKSVDELDRALHAYPPDYANDPLKWGFGVRMSLDVSGRFVWQPTEQKQGRLTVEKMWSYKRRPAGSEEQPE
jgi:hypothetical protein